MFGYLRLERTNATAETRKYYRQEYCTLCHALWKFYGYKPRFLLSYDVTFMAALLDLDPQISFKEKLPICYFRKDVETDIERWRKLSAISVLLAAEKLRDNIYDDKSVIARIIIAFFGKSIKRAEKDYPELSLFLKEGFKKMNEIEKSNGNVYAMADAFADIMTGSKRILFGESDFEDAVLRHVASWIYFIDAIDDLDKDAKDGSFNPFLRYASSRLELTTNHFDEIEKFVIKQKEELMPHFKAFKVDSNRSMTILNITNYAMPSVTANILAGRKAQNKSDIHVGYIESKGGMIFA